MAHSDMPSDTSSDFPLATLPKASGSASDGMRHTPRHTVALGDGPHDGDGASDRVIASQTPTCTEIAPGLADDATLSSAPVAVSHVNGS